jgi:hypothetical protein
MAVISLLGTALALPPNFRKSTSIATILIARNRGKLTVRVSIEAAKKTPANANQKDFPDEKALYVTIKKSSSKKMNNVSE